MTSRKTATMTSLTDHSVESILRDNDSNNETNSDGCSAVAGHVSYSTGNGAALLTQHGDRYATPEVVFNKSRAGPKPRLELERPDLWHQFYSLCTEMVITKSGRSIIKRFNSTSVTCTFLCRCNIFVLFCKSNSTIAANVY